ncbi:DUF1700 domain-containing protein [Bacillus massiliigorillae]|uniref:DUF1700 domain-containing protein n=1 Tax=Bacillus massiliigorillae TaxID=1243664 RepID=UPI0003999175|nr:DUF1700 domain-containing protein [Bacillus massiliigorillae]
MNKETYLKQLESKLKRLPSYEVEAALEYYNEYFDEAGEENVQQVIKELGSPAQVASKILADYAIKDLDSHPESTKKGFSAIWIIILAILASPIALPLVIAVGALIFAFVLLFISLAFAGFALTISLIIAGIASVVAGVAVLAQHIPTAIFFIGIGLTATGIGILIFSPVISLIKKGSRAIALSLKKLFDRISKRSKGALK